MKLLRRLILLLPALTLISACLPGTLVADPVYPLPSSHAAVRDGLDYLRSQQDADGSIGGYADSAWACIAIAAAGENPSDWNNGGASLVEYLKQGPPEPFDEFNMGTFLSRMVLAAVAAGEDPSAFGEWSGSHGGVDIIDGDYVGGLKSLHNGTQFLQDLTGDADSAATLNDDFWAVRALIAAGESPGSSLIQSSVDFIIENQEPDGGWTWGTKEHSFYAPDSTDVDNTSAAIVALSLGERRDSDAVRSGIAYLRDHQHGSGGFESVWMGVNVQSSAWAVFAIVASGGTPVDARWTPVDANPIDSLLSSQEEDGSFGGAVWPTADTIIALTGFDTAAGGDVGVSHVGIAARITSLGWLLPAAMALGIALLMLLTIRYVRRWRVR